MSEAPRDVRRILVALDASPHSQAALNAAVRLAATLGAELQGLFIEDETLIRAAKLPFAREVRTYGTAPRPLTGDRIERQIRDRAEYAKYSLKRLADQAGIAHAFDTVRGKVVAEVLAAAEDADLLALGKAGTRSSRRRLGPKARQLLLQAPTPVLVLRERLRYFQPVLTYYDGSEPTAQALRLAAQLSQLSEESPLKVLIPGDPTDRFAALREDVIAAFGSSLPGLHVRAVIRPTPKRLAAIAREESSGLVVFSAAVLSPPDAEKADAAPADETDDPPPLQAFLYELDSPVVLVK